MIFRLSGTFLSLACAALLLFPETGAAQDGGFATLQALTRNEGPVGQRGSALPEEDSGAAPRRPELNLPTSGEAPVNPFAEEQQTQVSEDEIEAMIREQALAAALTGLLPMRPEDIRLLLERFDDTQQAVEVPVYPYPEPEVLVDTVSLDPGTKPPVIKVGVGHVTTLNMLDVTGAPWPIQDITWAGKFEVITPEPGGHVIWITGMSEFGYGNLSVRLLELKTPVTFTIKTSRDSVYYRFDARIPEYGPHAQAPLIEGGMTIVAGNSILSSILDGLPPEGSERLAVSGVDGRTTAYLFRDTTYVRTPLTLLSPGWSGSVSSADGMNVYAIANSPVVLLSDRGQVVRAGLSEKEPLDD